MPIINYLKGSITKKQILSKSKNGYDNAKKNA